MLSRKKLLITYILSCLCFCANAYARYLHFGNNNIELFENCTTEHKLNVSFGNELWCAPLTTTWADNSLHVTFNGTTYTTCGTSCNGTTPEDEVPEIPPEPVVIEDENCEWSQTNSNAYLLSDGNQYFDTKVGVNSLVNIDVTAEIVNGVSAPLVGTVGTGCWYEIYIDDAGVMQYRIGTSQYGKSIDDVTMTGKHEWRTVNSNGAGTKKDLYQDETKVSYINSYRCNSDSNTILVFKTGIAPNLNVAQNGGMKLYKIKVTDTKSKLLHEYQPVAKGTNICGYITPQNGMWDKVTKKFYLAGGSGVMRYGVDE